jgi:predicted ATPase
MLLGLEKIGFFHTSVEDAFNEIKFFSIVPKIIKSKAYQINARISLIEDGSNLGVVLANSEPEFIHLLIQKITKIIGINIINAIICKAERHSINITVQVNSEEMAHTSISDGIIKLIAICTALLSSSNSGVIILDEPEQSLHFSLIKNLYLYFNEFIKDKRNQIIVASHDYNIAKIILNQKTSPLYSDNEASSLQEAIPASGTDLEILSNAQNAFIFDNTDPTKTIISASSNIEKELISKLFGNLTTYWNIQQQMN